MKIIILAILTMTSGARVEVQVMSPDVCLAIVDALAAGETVQVEDEAGVLEHVAAVECQSRMVTWGGDAI